MTKKLALLALFLYNTGYSAPYIDAALLKRGAHSIRSVSSYGNNFGKKHFIIDYPDYLLPPQDQNSSEKIDQSEFCAKRKTRRKKVQEQSGILNECLVDPDCMCQSFFTSKDNLNAIFLELINAAQKSILIAAFTITDVTIVKSLQEAKSRGVLVEVITDFESGRERYSRISELVNANIPVSYYSSDLNKNPRQKGSRWARMHHKIGIFDEKVVTTGSANLTRSGQRDNMENILLVRYPNVVSKFIEEFNLLRTQSKKYENSI